MPSFNQEILNYINSHNNSEFTVDELMKHLRTYNRRVIVAALRNLEAQKHGTFIEGRKGRLSRYVPFDTAQQLPKPFALQAQVIKREPNTSTNSGNSSNMVLNLTIEPSMLSEVLNVLATGGFNKRPKLGTILVESGSISEKQLNEALAAQVRWPKN